MVEQRTLTPLVLVRIQVPQPTWTKACIFLQAFVFIEFFEFERSGFRTRRKTVFFARNPLIFRQFADFLPFRSFGVYVYYLSLCIILLHCRRTRKQSRGEMRATDDFA